ncbi:MAG: DNA-binding protein, partial [Bacteroides sp.]|nr:DNA-binding protein [Bacteroides sp.]
RPTLSARAVDNEEDANANTVRRKRILFTPGAAFKGALDQMSVTRYAMPDTDWTDGSSGSGPSGGDGGGNDGGNDGNGEDESPLG